MSRFVLVLALSAIPAIPAAAQTVTGDEAAAMLFAPDAIEVELLVDTLPENEAGALTQVAKAQPYYGAVAISPDEGLMSEATMAAVDHHTVDAASAAALAVCNAKKKGAADCVVAAVIRPEGWEARPLQLSSSATSDFANYSGALAISAATGSWGIGNSAEEAVAACAAKQQAATDCAVAIAD